MSFFDWLFGKKKKGWRIEASVFEQEIRASIANATYRLEQVGAKVRRSGSIKVTFRPGTDRTYLGWGFRHSTGVIGGLTAGRHTTIATTASGEYQPLIAELELCHQILKGTEASDYGWIKRAYPEWRGE